MQFSNSTHIHAAHQRCVLFGPHINCRTSLVLAIRPNLSELVPWKRGDVNLLACVRGEKEALFKSTGGCCLQVSQLQLNQLLISWSTSRLKLNKTNLDHSVPYTAKINRNVDMFHFVGYSS